MGNPMLVLIALFIFAAAGGEARYVKARETEDAPPPANAAVESGPWGDVRPLDPSGASSDQR